MPKYDFSGLEFLRKKTPNTGFDTKHPDRKVNWMRTQMVYLISSLAEVLNAEPSIWYGQPYNHSSAREIFSAGVRLVNKDHEIVSVKLYAFWLGGIKFEYKWAVSVFGTKHFNGEDFEAIRLYILDSLLQHLR